MTATSNACIFEKASKENGVSIPAYESYTKREQNETGHTINV